MANSTTDISPLTGFEEGKFDSTTKQRVILAFFYLDSRVLGRLKPEVSCLLDFVDKHENNEWVILVSPALVPDIEPEVFELISFFPVIELNRLAVFFATL